ncbi:pre-mRNA-splicing factor ATP-dependent RNA helicase DEAH7 [Tanacetum coccineum]
MLNSRLEDCVYKTSITHTIVLRKGDSSDMAKISRKVPTSNLVRKVQERQSMSKLRLCFWELAGSKLGNILVLRSLQSEVDFKGDAKFAHDMKTCAISDLAMSIPSLLKTLDYLHIRCQTAIVHGGLKPSNILLDADMVAHVGRTMVLASSTNCLSSSMYGEVENNCNKELYILLFNKRKDVKYVCEKVEYIYSQDFEQVTVAYPKHTVSEGRKACETKLKPNPIPMLMANWHPTGLAIKMLATPSPGTNLGWMATPCPGHQFSAKPLFVIYMDVIDPLSVWID